MVGKLDCMPGGEIGITEYFVDGGIMLLLESVVCVAR